MDQSNQLVGVTVIVPVSVDAGGTVLSASPDLVVNDEATGPFRLGDRYSAAGVEGLRDAVVALLGVGVTKVQVLDPVGWAALLDPIDGLVLDLPDALVPNDDEANVVEVPAGLVDLTPVQVVDVFGHLNPGESPANRVSRQELIWTAWVNALDDGPNTLPELDLPLVDVLGVLEGGPLVVQSVPSHIQEIPTDTGALLRLLVPDVEATRATALDAVAFPVSATGAERVSVRLLNGTDTVDLDTVVTDIGSRIVAAGGSLTIIGNSDSLANATSEIRYREGSVEAANQLGEALGISARIADDDPRSVADITVVVGRDLAPGSSS